MENITIDYDVVREGEVIFEGSATVSITAKNVKEVAEFIRDGHFTGELVDIPSHVYDRIERSVNEAAMRDMRKHSNTGLQEDDILRFQTVLPIELLELLPEDVRELIDMTQIDEYYSSGEDERDVTDLNEWCLSDNKREEPSKSNTLYLTIKQKYFDQIISGEKTEEYREIKPTTYKKYLFVDDEGELVQYDKHVFDEKGIEKHLYNAWNDGVFPYIPANNQYLDLAVGYNKERDTARVEVTGCRFEPAKDENGNPLRFSLNSKDQLVYDPEGDVTYWIIALQLGKVLECHRVKK